MGTNGSFSGIKDTFSISQGQQKQLTPQGEQLIQKFNLAYKGLKDEKITTALTRLDRLDDDVKAYAPALDLLQRHIPDREVFIEDIEEACAGSMHRWNLLRTISALLPLLLTWISLAVATLLYKGEPAQVNSSTTQVIQSFLAQWQSGFGDHGSLFKFSNVAFFDAFLISCVVLFTVLVHTAEAKPKRIIKDVEPAIEQALRSLTIAIEQQGAVINPASVQGLVRQSAGMMSSAIQDLKAAAVDWKSAAASTESTIRDIRKDSADTLKTLGDEINQNLKKTQLGIQAVLDTLKDEIQQVIRNEMGSILKDYQATLTEFKEQVKEYKDASTELVGEAKKLSAEGATLAAEAANYTSIATDIDVNMTKLEKSHTDFVNKVDGIAADMNTAAGSAKTAVDELDKTVVPELETTSKQLKNASTQLEKASDTLATTNTQLDGTTTDLRAAGGDLRSIGGTLSGIPVSLGGGSKGPSRLMVGGLMLNFGTLMVLLVLLVFLLAR